MKNVVVSSLIMIVAFVFVSCGSGGAGSGKTLAKVGGEKITEGDLDMLSNINPRLKAQLSTDLGKKKILDNLVEQELLYVASKQAGMDKDPNVKDKIDIYRRVIISQAYLDKKLEEAARNYYDEHKGEFEKLQLSHILIGFKQGEKDTTKRTEKEAIELANKIKERITGGEDFSEVAKEVSDDQMTKKRGGDLGFASKDEPRLARRGLGPILEKAFTMGVGTVEGPIKAEDGYHIIKVTKGADLQPFDAVQQQILFKIRAGAKNEILGELKTKYKVEYLAATGGSQPEAKPTNKPETPTTQDVKPEGAAPEAAGSMKNEQTPPETGNKQ